MNLDLGVVGSSEIKDTKRYLRGLEEKLNIFKNTYN